MKGIVVCQLPDPGYGNPTIARIVPSDDHPWGHYRFLVGTPWESLFPRIPHDVLDQALRGHVRPLMQILGPPPKAFVKRLPLVERPCAQRKSCINAGDHCIPGPKLPDCWEPNTFHGEQATLMNYVVRQWRDGTIIIVELDQ